MTLAVNNVTEDGQGPFVAIDFYTDNIDPAVIFAEIAGRHANGSDVMTERVYWWMTHSPWGNRLAKFRQWVEPAGEWTFVAHETARDGTRLGPTLQRELRRSAQPLAEPTAPPRGQPI